MKITATKVEITGRNKDDLPGYKNDHKHYNKSDGGFNQKMDQEDLKTYTAAFVIRGENIGSNPSFSFQLDDPFSENGKISNHDLAQIIDTSDEWISSRTRIRNRRILTGKETLTGLAVEAAQKALQMAKLEPDDVDLILNCSSTPESLFGGAAEVQKTLGCKRNPPAYDIRAACSGFLLGLVSASCHIRGGGFKNVLVIGADCISRYVEWTDRKTCVLFGDAAGAILVHACDIEEDVTPQTIEASLANTGLRLSEIEWLLVHQANQRIIDYVTTKLEFPKDRVISNLGNYGNTSAASIPLALDEAVRSGNVKEDDTIITVGFGAGLTWGSAIVRWC
nr:3-oxoacyl-[acyl-carrier-protein] synthase 3 A, chloroplastic-like isoform X2 [Tanacetum cinerariifolium]